MDNRTASEILARQLAPGGALTSFPKSETIRAAFLGLATDLCAKVQEDGTALSEPQQQGLFVKLGKYCAKYQWQLAEVAAQIPTIADAIGEKPEALTDPTLTLKKMLDLHITWNQQIAAEVRREILANPNADVPPEIIARSDDGAYLLVECRTQRHLQEDTAALGHCVGGTHLDHYRDKLARGASRIFSLRTAAGVPVATIEYDTKAKAIAQIERTAGANSITGSEAFFPALCQTVHRLCRQIQVGRISGLPQPDYGKVLTPDGTRIAFEQADMATILAGIVCVDNRMTQEMIDRLCASPRLMLDVTALDLSRLPAQVKCQLFSSATSFDAPQLQSAGDISANNATSFSLPLLQTARLIYARSATSLSLPQLQIAGDIYTISATSFSLPLLQTAGNIYADSATSFDAPQLQTAGEIDIRSATSVSVPLLKTGERIYAPARRVSSPASSGNLNPHAPCQP